MFTDIDIECRICSFYTTVKPAAWVKLVMQFLVLTSGPPRKYQVADKIYPRNFAYRFVTVDL
jgi:hypothetical protein